MYFAETKPLANLDVLVGTKLAQTMKTAGLHRLVARREKIAGFGDFEDSVDLKDVVNLIGQKAFIKRAEQKCIAQGIAALNALGED